MSWSIVYKCKCGHLMSEVQYKMNRGDCPCSVCGAKKEERALERLENVQGFKAKKVYPNRKKRRYS